ncbi:MAG TPA: hypothetical protein VFB31_17015 [Pseudolabrys sp.]|nr:hypothetical protein [Pseudolabrys sp.]
MNRNRYIRSRRAKSGHPGGGFAMLAFEMVGLALFALFFGALITNKESVSR